MELKISSVLFSLIGTKLVMGNDIRDSPGTNEEHSSLKLSVYFGLFDLSSIKIRNIFCAISHGKV